MDLLNRTDCAAKIVDLGSRAANVQADIHVCAVSSVAHMRDHGDYRTALQLMNALPNGIRVQGLAAWFRNYTSNKFAVSYDSKDKAWKGSLRKDRSEEDFKVDEAMLVSFADFTKERAPKAFDLIQLIRFIKAKADESDDLKVTPGAREGASKLYRLAIESGIAPNI